MISTSAATRNGHPVASTTWSASTPGVEARERQLAAARVGFELSHVGDHRADTASGESQRLPRSRPVSEADRGAKGELVDERARRVLDDHQRLLAGRGDLGRAAAAGKPHLGIIVGADHGAVEIGEAVDLRSPQEADVDAAALQPVGEDLRHADHCVGGLGQLAVADRERQVVRLGADRPALVDQHTAGGVGRPGEVGRPAGQADADEADGAVTQPPRRGDRHHLLGRVGAHTAAASSTCSDIHWRKLSRSRLIASHRR